jgi:replicative DNA helicase
MTLAKQKSNAIIRLADKFTDIAVSSLFNKDSEYAVIGSVLHEPEHFFQLAEIVKAQDFSVLMCAFIWHAFEELAATGREIDYLTVSQTVPTIKGFPAGLTEDDVLSRCAEMMTAVPRLEHVMEYAQMVADTATRIRIVQAADNIRKAATDKTLTIDDVIQQVDTISFESTKRRNMRPTDLASLASDYHDQMERGMQGDYVSIVPSGFHAMDRIMQGYRKSEVHVIAGGPGMGKSTWLLSQLIMMAKRIKHYNLKHGTNIRIVHFTMEMLARECIEKWVMQETGLAQWKLQRPAKMSTEDRKLFTHAVAEVSTLPIDIVDEYGSLRPVDMRTRVKRYMQEYDVCMITVDGLWLMEPDYVPGNMRIQPDQITQKYLTQRITGIAKDFDVPIVMLHQYNQDGKNRGNKRPLLSDMKWGQAVQQDFHTIWGMHRLRGEDNAQSDDANVKFYGLKGRSNTQIEGSMFELMFDESRNLYRDLIGASLP